MTQPTQLILSKTQSWIRDFIITLNVCPFAAAVFNENKIAYRIFQKDKNQCQPFLFNSIRELDTKTNIETSLLIFPEMYNDFYDFLELIQIGEDIIVDGNYEGVYQFASFHPSYRFENSNEEDAENYTNRSPYPMLHLIREKSITEAIEKYGPTENIPTDNINNLKKIGYQKLKHAFTNSDWSPLKNKFQNPF